MIEENKINPENVHKAALELKKAIEDMGGEDVVVLCCWSEGGFIHFSRQSNSCLTTLGVCEMIKDHILAGKPDEDIIEETD